MKNLKIKTDLTSTQTDCDVSVNKLTVFWADDLDSDQLLVSSLSRRSLHIYRVKRGWETQSWTTFNPTLMHDTILNTSSGSTTRRWRSCWRSRWTSPFSLILHQIITQLLPLLETERIQSVCTSQASVDLKHDLLLVISSPVKTKLKRSQSDSHRIWVYSF